MDTIPNIKPAEIPDGHDCGDCIWYSGCRKMDEINRTSFCEKIGQKICPKDHFVLDPGWEETRKIREDNKRRHRHLVKKQKRKKKRR